MKKILAALIFASSLATSQAATISWSAGQDVGLVNASGTVLSTGNLVRLGYFTITDSAVQAAINDLPTLNAAWHSIADTTIGTGTSNTPGSFTINSTPTISGAELGHQVYIWALNAPTVLGATQQAIFYEPSTSNSSWNLPGSNIGSTTIDINQAKTSLGGTYLAGTFQVSNASVTSTFGAPSGAVQLATISASPEPSKMLLILAGSALVMVRRRRRI